MPITTRPDALATPASESTLHHLLGELVSLNNRLTRIAAQATGSTESPGVWRTLVVLRDLGPMRVGELARASRVSQPTMTKILHALDERGWIRRIADDGDARAWTISADPAGLAALADWRAQVAAALAPRFADLDEAELATIAHAVELVRSRIVEPGDGAGASASATDAGAAR